VYIKAISLCKSEKPVASNVINICKREGDGVITHLHFCLSQMLEAGDVAVRNETMKRTIDAERIYLDIAISYGCVSDTSCKASV
jgi:hypothetical protein